MIKNKGHESGPRANRYIAPTLAFLTMVSAFAYFLNGKDGPAPQPVVAESATKLATCAGISSQQNNLPNWASNREGALTIIARLGDCFDKTKQEFNLKSACEFISEGIETNSPKWKHPILFPFYSALYNDLRCAFPVATDANSRKRYARRYFRRNAK